MKPLRVLLCDDYAIVREGLRRILETGLEIVGEVADGRELVADPQSNIPLTDPGAWLADR